MARLPASASTVVRTIRFAGANATAGETFNARRSPAPVGSAIRTTNPRTHARTLIVLTPGDRLPSRFTPLACGCRAVVQVADQLKSQPKTCGDSAPFTPPTAFVRDPTLPDRATLTRHRRQSRHPRSTANVVQVDSFVTTARQPFSNWRTPVFPSPRRLACALIAVLTVTAPGARLRAESTPAWLDQYRDPAARLIGAAISDTFAWRRLAVLTDSIGNRLSGTPQLDRAIRWAAEEMKRDGLENVHTEKAMVPKWVRGAESAEILEPARHPIAMLGLGGSVATPADGVQADVLVVHSFEELDATAAQARGRIVFFNVAYTNYGETVRFRSGGPSRAAAYGAVAMLIRSVGLPGLRVPHTGALQYTPDAPKIPAAAVASEDADRLQRMADRGDRVVVRLKMQAHFDPDVESANVV